MIRWSQVAPALIEVFSGLALDAQVDPEFRAQWAEGAKEFVHPQVAAELTLKVTSVATVPGDEIRYENVTVTPTVGEPYTMLTESIVGHRRFVLQVRVESFDHTPTADNWCWSILERIRTRLRLTRIQQTLLAVNVATLDVGAANDTTYTFDKRRVNAAVMDVTFYAAFVDTDSVKMNWIERVELTSHIQNTDGNQLPSPPNVTALPVPPVS